MPTFIMPTVGRIVYYYLKSNQPAPLAAIITAVLGERLVNLCTFDSYGGSTPCNGVPLVQPGDKVPEGKHCMWMDYQVGQAARTDSLERQLRDRVGELETKVAELMEANAAKEASTPTAFATGLEIPVQPKKDWDPDADSLAD